MNNVNAIESSPVGKAIIMLKSVFGKNTYNQGRTLHLPPSVDVYGDWNSEFIRRVDHHGDLILGTNEDPKDNYIKETDIFSVNDGTTFDLSKDKDKKIWEAIKDHNTIANSFEEGQNSGTAYLYVHEDIKEAKKEIKIHSSKYIAMKYIMEDSKANLYQIAKLLGSPMDNVTMEEVQAFLLSIANKTPNKIIDTYTDDSFSTKIFLTDALAKGIILHQGGVYMFMVDSKPIVLGMNESTVISWLMNPTNRPLVTDIGLQCNPAPKKVIEKKPVSKTTAKK